MYKDNITKTKLVSAMLNFHAKTEESGLNARGVKAFFKLAYGQITNNQVVWKCL